MNTETIQEMLRNIELSGDSAAWSCKHLIGSNPSQILNLSSGAVRIQPHALKHFALILSQPKTLAALNPFEIHCCLCNEIVNYPCWYYEVKYAVNHFHYFVCFNSSTPEKPTTRCYRRR